MFLYDCSRCKNKECVNRTKTGIYIGGRKTVIIPVDQSRCMECGKEVDTTNSLVSHCYTIKGNKGYQRDGFKCFDCAGWNGLPPAGRGHIGPGTEEYERRTKCDRPKVKEVK